VGILGHHLPPVNAPPVPIEGPFSGSFGSFCLLSAGEYNRTPMKFAWKDHRTRSMKVCRGAICGFVLVFVAIVAVVIK